MSAPVASFRVLVMAILQSVSHVSTSQATLKKLTVFLIVTAHANEALVLELSAFVFGVALLSTDRADIHFVGRKVAVLLDLFDFAFTERSFFLFVFFLRFFLLKEPLPLLSLTLRLFLRRLLLSFGS